MLFSGKSPYEYLVNAGVSQGSIVGPTFHLLYINDLLDHVICDIAVCADDTLYCKFYQAFLISGKNFNWLLNLNLIYITMWTGVRSGLFISMLDRKTELVSFNQSNNTGSIDVKTDGSVLEENSSFKMLWLTFSSKLDWGSCIISIAKTASKKIGTATRSMRFLSPEVVLYLYKRSLHLFVLLCIFKPLVHHGNVASLTLFYRYYFCRCTGYTGSIFVFLEGGLPIILIDCMIFFVTIPRCYKDVYVSIFFCCTARLWNSLPIECFSLNCYLNGFKSRINRHLLRAGCFERDFLYALIFFFFLL